MTLWSSSETDLDSRLPRHGRGGRSPMYSPTSRPPERQQHYPERPNRKTQRFRALSADAPDNGRLVESRCGAVAVGSHSTVSARFGRRCLNRGAIAPLPHPAHRTEQADFPHSALGQDHQAIAHGRRLLPLPVGRRVQLDAVAPSVQLLSEPSTLLRATPSLCLTSVLGSLWGLPTRTSPVASRRQVLTFRTRA